MSAIGSRHAACVSRLAELLHTRAGSAAIVRVQDPIVLDDYSEPQPDLVVARRRDDFYRDAHPGPADVLPLIEVADTLLHVEKADKIPLYARARIPEVWLVELSGGLVEVHRRPVQAGYADDILR